MALAASPPGATISQCHPCIGGQPVAVVGTYDAVTQLAGRLALAILAGIRIGLGSVRVIAARYAAKVSVLAAIVAVLAHELSWPAKAGISVPSAPKCSSDNQPSDWAISTISLSRPNTTPCLISRLLVNSCSLKTSTRRLGPRRGCWDAASLDGVGYFSSLLDGGMAWPILGGVPVASVELA